jgi:D-alanyl-D-alanine carboxypeptidase (penicillin-binding protein 5/6)
MSFRYNDASARRYPCPCAVRHNRTPSTIARVKAAPVPRQIDLLSVALAAVLVFSPVFTAQAAVLDGDVVGGTKVGERSELRGLAPDLYIPAGQLSTMDGRDLWDRDVEARRSMASTTKMMTAVVVLENASLDEMVTVGKTGMKVGESGMGLRSGERISVRDLLEGMLIQSGNDAAMALAEHVAGSVPRFVDMMNAKAGQLDLVNTRYLNPHGLDVPGHYTSAEDLTSLARYAMRIPEFRRIVGTYKTRVVTAKYTHQLQSTNLMLKQYSGADGIKTGWTDEAGYCIVASAKRGDIELVATVLGAASEAGRFGQATRLLDWGFAHYKPTAVATAGVRTGNVRVSDYVERTVPSETSESTSVAVFDLAGPVRTRVDLKPEVSAPVVKGQRLGTMTVFQGDRLLAQVPLTAAIDVPAPTFWQSVGFFFIRVWRGIVGDS